MKSVGEAMAIGRTFQESFQKALRSLETDRAGWGCDRRETLPKLSTLRSRLRTPNPERIFSVHHAMQLGLTIDEIYGLTGIDPWFLHQLAGLIETEKWLKRTPLTAITAQQMVAVKQQGFSDEQIAFANNVSEDLVRTYPQSLGGDPCLQNCRHLRGGVRSLHPLLLLHL
jgi:carbamoyl-phosphate synthase large subunit